MNKQYQQDIIFLESLSNIPHSDYLLNVRDRRVFLIRLKKFLQLVNNPEKNLKVIHIAGTSGKGSTVKLLEAMITKAGLKVGSYTSPFATTTLEKLSVNNKLISPQDLHRILDKKIKPALDQYLLKYPKEPISYFEAFTALALIYFQEAKCDWVILETGCGGTHDATNIIPDPKITAITNIGLDHTHLLGNTKTKIAKDKAGIIKKNSLFLTTEKNKKLLQIFKKKCQQAKAWYINLENLTKEYNLSTYFSTKKQKDNLNLVLNILNLLKIKPSQLVINNFRMMCRQEIIQTKPLIILDGAHNFDKLNNLTEFIKTQRYNKLHLILGIANNKKSKTAIKKLISLTDQLYLTRFLVSFRKSASLPRLSQEAKSISPQLNIQLFNDPHQALAKARQSAKSNDLILITGSFFLTGELRKRWISEDYILQNRKVFKN